jgi:hypothetical protein
MFEEKSRTEQLLVEAATRGGTARHYCRPSMRCLRESCTVIDTYADGQSQAEAVAPGRGPQPASNDQQKAATQALPGWTVAEEWRSSME